MFAILGFVIANLRERLLEFFFNVPRYDGDPIDRIYESGSAGWVLLAIAAALVLILVAFYFGWRMHTFRVNQEAVEVRSGLVFRSNRKARLDRIQGVNIVRSLIPRLFGAAKLEVSVAGQDANVQLAYLKSSLADDLRRDILRLASGARRPDAPAAVRGQADGQIGAARAGTDETITDGSVAPETVAAGEPNATEGRVAAAASGIGGFATERVHDFLAPELDPDAAPPESVVTIPPARLIGSIVFSGFTVFVILAVTALIIAVSSGGTGWILFAIFPGVVGSVGYYISRFTKSLRYSIAGTTDGVRVGFGLLSTSNETLPPGRIHAIQVSQPLIWRPFGWWQIRINKAGHSTNQGAAGQASTTTLPVGTRADVGKVLELILPEYGGEAQQSLIERGMFSRGGDDGFTNAPRRAIWLRPFTWRRTGYTVSDGVALLRRGVISRDLILVPLARLQSVGIEQGPIQRMLRLASARLHTVAGPVGASLSVVDVDEASRLLERVSAGAVESANLDTSHRWHAADVATAPEGPVLAPAGAAHTPVDDEAARALRRFAGGVPPANERNTRATPDSAPDAPNVGAPGPDERPTL